MEKQTENRLMDMERGEERVRYMERVTWKLPKKKRQRTCNTWYLLYALVLIYYLSSQPSEQLKKEVVTITLILQVTEFRPRS